MKILEVIPKLQSGGAEKFVVDLTNELGKRSYDCTLVTLYDTDENDILSTHLDDNIKKFSLGKKMGIDLKCMFRLFQYIRKEKPNVVHAHVGAITYLILSAVLFRKCKYFATIHSEAKREAGRGVNKIIRKFLFKYYLVHPVTISDESEKSFQVFYNRSGNLIPNGCSVYQNLETFVTKKWREKSDYLFIHVGRLQRVKNQISLVKAFIRLIEDGTNVTLLILGRKEDRQVYEEIKPYFSENIVYLGEQSDCRAYMSECDAFCLSSTMEGMPITIIEAFSVGCIPIVTPVGGCVNMIEDGVNGILTTEVSEKSIYLSLKRFVNLNNAERTKLSLNAKKTYEIKYSIKKSASEYIYLFERL